jgi:catechol 2,3-dioxygenase-like lactoylglutathione lyase family enzyme
MKIKLNSVSIDDYDKALKFYTEILGFVKKNDIPLGEGVRWITVVSPDEPNGTELLLEPNAWYPAKTLKDLWSGMSLLQHSSWKCSREYENEEPGVNLMGHEYGHDLPAVFDDTCSNLIQIYQLNAT